MINSIDIYNKLYCLFIANAREWILELENGLLRLEKSPADRELINNIFRIAHNIKSTSGTVGLEDIYKFTHKVEDILSLVRQEKLTPDRKLIDSLLESVDLITEMVESAVSKKQFDYHRCEDWMKKMERYING
jgi:two-component system chemotaxis sensor kinase CheA